MIKEYIGEGKDLLEATAAAKEGLVNTLGLKNEDEIKIEVEDIKLVGSNCSYNYTKDSDLDIHIVSNTSKLNCKDNLYPVVYDAYKSLFNSKYDIDFYGIPVEIYVETSDTALEEDRKKSALKSNGIYSVLKNE